VEHPAEAQPFPRKEKDTDVVSRETVENRCFDRNTPNDDDPFERIDRHKPFTLALRVERDGVAVEFDVKILSIDVKRAHVFSTYDFSPDVKIIRVLRLDGNAKGMSPAPAIHGKDVHSILLGEDEFLEFLFHVPEFAIRQEALVDGLLPASAIAFEKITDPRQTAIVRYVVRHEITYPFHETRIPLRRRRRQQQQYCGNVSSSVVKEQRGRAKMTVNRYQCSDTNKTFALNTTRLSVCFFFLSYSSIHKAFC